MYLATYLTFVSSLLWAVVSMATPATQEVAGVPAKDVTAVKQRNPGAVVTSRLQCTIRSDLFREPNIDISHSYHYHWRDRIQHCQRRHGRHRGNRNGVRDNYTEPASSTIRRREHPCLPRHKQRIHI